MKRLLTVMLVLVFFAVFGFAQNHALASSDDVSVQLAQKDTDAAAAEEEDDDDDEDYDDDDYEDDDVQLIADPLQQMNFDFYELNNGLYYTFLKPVAIGWKTISPEGLRMMIKNFMYNIRFPVRFIN